ncbi:hypothetical protein BDM02DRAFT_452521 [Thelephora ganbajun]|uniref:Uncharacterized protein n=1 Tax=Thelephora ganbajun TaxID=370292 RepID=A0ACB6ZQZ6_THEGA|nr:hypothetical protein BDM02DRAFT_452521 [Thelephora ganbajun]
MLQFQTTLPPVRRIVTAHDGSGKEIISSDSPMPAQVEILFAKMLIPNAHLMTHLQCVPQYNVALGKIWVTDSFPSDDNNTEIDGATREINGISAPKNAACLFTDLGPGEETPMHRTSTIDLNVLLSGEVVLVFPDGTRTYLKNPGDTVVQRGTNHAWKNIGTTWTRWVTFVIDATPARVNGRELVDVLLTP